MNSQRAREARIVEKLGSDALHPAPSSEAMPVAPTTPNAAGRCRGCDELEADALVGDHPWHHLCYLFWQGRSDTLQGPQTPTAEPDSGMMPERSRWVIVVRTDRPAVYSRLRRNYAGSAWVDVVMDRRGIVMDRRSGSSPGHSHTPAVERRGGLPRRWNTSPHPAFRRTYQGEDYQVYEATAPLAGHCPQCRLVLTVELPNFAEPPARLDLTVVHEIIPPATVRHVVDVQSLSATGQVLFTSQLRARPLQAT
jgi:hypothetical protein